MTRKILVLAFVVLFVSSAPLLAQDELIQYNWVLDIHAEPGKIGQFESYVRQVQEAATKVSEPGAVTVFQTLLGGPINRYFVVRTFNSWDEMDGWKPVPQLMAEAYGQDEAIKMLATGGESIMSIENTVQSTQQNFSSASPGPIGRLIHAVRTVINPAKRDQYLMFLAKLSEAEKAAGVEVIRRQVIHGPEFATFIALRGYASHAARGQAPTPGQVLEELVGEDQAEIIMDGQFEAVVEREMLLLQFRPDLSRIPGN